VLVELDDPALGRVVDVTVVVVVAVSALMSNAGSSLKREPSAMSRALSIGAKTQRQPEPGSAGSMMSNSRPMGEEMGTAGST